MNWMRGRKYCIRIKHPECLAVSHPQRSIDLYRKGLCPESIAGWMIIVGLKHPLRAVYGSDLRAAVALLWQAIRNKTIEPLAQRVWQLTHRKEWEEMLKETYAQPLTQRKESR